MIVIQSVDNTLADSVVLIPINLICQVRVQKICSGSHDTNLYTGRLYVLSEFSASQVQQPTGLMINPAGVVLWDYAKKFPIRDMQ